MFVVWLSTWLALAVVSLELWRRRHTISQRWSRFQHYQRTINAIPGPRSYPFIGTTYMMRGKDRAQVPRVMQRQFDEFPRLSRTWLGPIQAHVHVTCAEHMEIVLGSSTQHNGKSWAYAFLEPWLGEGLLTSSGERWRKHRKIITPTFHFGILESFGEIFGDKASVLAGKLEPFAESGAVVDVYPLVALAALDIIAEAAMGCEVHAQEGQNHDYVASINNMGELLLRRLIRPWLYPKQIYNWSGDGLACKRTLNTLHSFTTGVISKRTEALKSASDEQRTTTPADATPVRPSARRLAFLDMLLNCGDTLSGSDIREEVDTFMFEGHDTTTSGMVWAMLLLGLHADVQEQAFEECSGIFGDSERSATQADVGRMALLERVIKESMRLYPPVPNISRCLSEDIVLDGYTVPSGTTAILEMVHLHQDERYFPDHRRFDPDRFLPENTRGRHPFAYLPFSAGARNCIGQKFAMFEEKSVLSTLIRRYRWKAAVECREEVEYAYELITRPFNGVPLIFEKRN